MILHKTIDETAISGYIGIMGSTLKRKPGRPKRAGDAPTRFTTVLPKEIGDVILALAKDTNRSPHFWTVQMLTEGAKNYQALRAEELQRQRDAIPPLVPFVVPAAFAAPSRDDDPIAIKVPKESAEELIQAAAAELEGKRPPPVPQSGDPNYKEKT